MCYCLAGLVTPAGPKASSGGAATGGPAAQWVAVQHPAKRQKPSAAAAAAAVVGQQPGEGDEGDEEGGGAAGGTAGGGAASGAFSPSKGAGARWNSEVLAHNAAVKADGQAMLGQRWACLEEQLAVLRPLSLLKWPRRFGEGRRRRRQQACRHCRRRWRCSQVRGAGRWGCWVADAGVLLILCWGAGNCLALPLS
jgi:hypothetical protein